MTDRERWEQELDAGLNALARQRLKEGAAAVGPLNYWRAALDLVAELIAECNRLAEEARLYRATQERLAAQLRDVSASRDALLYGREDA